MLLAVWPSSVPVLAKFLLSAVSTQVPHCWRLSLGGGGLDLFSTSSQHQPATSPAKRQPPRHRRIITTQHHNIQASSDRRKKHLNLGSRLDVPDISTTCCIWTTVDVRFALVFRGDSMLCVVTNYTTIPKSCAVVKIECNYLGARRALRVTIWQEIVLRFPYLSHRLQWICVHHNNASLCNMTTYS